MRASQRVSLQVGFCAQSFLSTCLSRGWSQLVVMVPRWPVGLTASKEGLLRFTFYTGHFGAGVTLVDLPFGGA